MEDIDSGPLYSDGRHYDLQHAGITDDIPFYLAHIHDHESIEGFLACVGAHPKSTGRFIIDIFNPRLEILIRDPSERYPVAGAGVVNVLPLSREHA